MTLKVGEARDDQQQRMIVVLEPEFTSVVLNWQRPDNVGRIVDGLRSGGLTCDAIIWNNNPEQRFEHPWALTINASRDAGLYSRFAAACLARSDCVLIQDDDIELPAESLRKLLEAWRADPQVLHGVFGRGPRSDGSYAQPFRGTGEVPIVLTRALMTHRAYAAAFLEEVGQFDAVQFDSQPYGNGEDIIFSYVVRRRSGRLNRVHDLPVVELPAPDAIHGRDRPEHMAHRDRVLRACEAWLHAAKEASKSGTNDAADLSAFTGHSLSSLDFTLPTSRSS